MLLLYYQFRLFTARIEIPCIIKRVKEVVLWKYKFLTTLIRKNHTERTMFPCLRTARRFLPFHHREKHVVSIPAWNGYLGSGLHPLRMEAGVGSLFWFICFLQVAQTLHSRKDHFLRAAAEYGKGIRILRQDPFEMLITFIISQRKSIPAIRSSVEKLCLAAGKEITKTGGLFTHFPPRQRSGNYLSMNWKTVLSGTGPPIFMPQPAWLREKRSASPKWKHCLIRNSRKNFFCFPEQASKW